LIATQQGVATQKVVSHGAGKSFGVIYPFLERGRAFAMK